MRQKHYLEAAARGLCGSCPGQARYLLWAYSSSHDDNGTFEETCPYCFQLLVLDNARVRLKPKAKLTPKIQKLLDREARNHTLSFKEAKLVKKYKDSASVLLITCKTCNRTVKHHGASRSFLSALKGDPAIPTSKLSLKTPERKTPWSTTLNHMSGSKGKSPTFGFRPWLVSLPALFLRRVTTLSSHLHACGFQPHHPGRSPALKTTPTTSHISQPRVSCSANRRVFLLRLLRWWSPAPTFAQNTCVRTVNACVLLTECEQKKETLLSAKNTP